MSIRHQVRFTIPPASMVRLLAVITIVTTNGLALDSTRPAGSYIRDDFTVEEGLPSNIVNAIAQTPNGFLWLGTDQGLARFNGRRFVPIQLHGNEITTQGVVNALAVGPAGDLWVGTGNGLVRFPSAALNHFDPALVTFYHPGTGKSDEVTCLHFGRNGTLWLGTNKGLFRLSKSSLALVLPNVSVSRLEESLDGHLLIITNEGFIEWDGSGIINHRGLAERLGVHDKEIFHVIERRDRSEWFCTLHGLVREMGGVIKKLSPHGTGMGAFRIMEDSHGTLWASMRGGVFRVYKDKVEPVALSLHPRSLYSDRDGNLWVGTNGKGLLRFKDRLIRMFNVADGLPSDIQTTVLAARDGRLWVGSSCGGVSLFDGERFVTFQKGLANTCVYSLAEDRKNGDLWLGTWGGGIFRMSNRQFTQYGRSKGLASDVAVSIIAARDGSIWIATDEGVSHMQNGQFRNYTLANGLSSDRVFKVYQDSHGNIWAGTSRGIDRLIGDRFVAIPSDRKVFDAPASSLAEDSEGVLYAFSAPKGISRVQGNRLVTVNAGLDLLSMVEFQQRELWFSSGIGIVRVPADFMKRSWSDQAVPVEYELFGKADGLNIAQGTTGSPNMAITSDGKLWVATVKGLAQMDLFGMARGHSKPAVFVDEIAIGRTKKMPTPTLDLPPGMRHLEIHFDAIELTSIEKIRFQYKLDDVDFGWLDADASRTAVYTSIPTGTHAFHIRACGVDGIWDRDGITYSVSQQPFFYETKAFQAVVVALFCFTVWAIYRLRLHQITTRLNERLDARLMERARLARDLHDTLLQTFQGLMLRFQAVVILLPDRPDQAKESLEYSIHRAAMAITEGRDAVADLRNHHLADNDLIESLSSLGTDVVAVQANAIPGSRPTHFRVLVEGTPRRLHPTTCDDLYRIAREAVANAYRHAQANKIEIDLCYDRRMLCLRVRDDGVGIDSRVLTDGRREGHWGLQGMRERAKSIGGQFKVWSELTRGTEIEVTILAGVAYHDPDSNHSSRDAQ